MSSATGDWSGTAALLKHSRGHMLSIACLGDADADVRVQAAETLSSVAEKGDAAVYEGNQFQLAPSRCTTIHGKIWKKGELVGTGWNWR